MKKTIFDTLTSVERIAAQQISLFHRDNPNSDCVCIAMEGPNDGAYTWLVGCDGAFEEDLRIQLKTALAARDASHMFTGIYREITIVLSFSDPATAKRAKRVIDPILGNHPWTAIN